jgi:hypothetical protein
MAKLSDENDSTGSSSAAPEPDTRTEIQQLTDLIMQLRTEQKATAAIQDAQIQELIKANKKRVTFQDPNTEETLTPTFKTLPKVNDEPDRRESLQPTVEDEPSYEERDDKPARKNYRERSTKLPHPDKFSDNKDLKFEY